MNSQRPASIQERRIAPDDMPYTKDEFFEHYRQEEAQRIWQESEVEQQHVTRHSGVEQPADTVDKDIFHVGDSVIAHVAVSFPEPGYLALELGERVKVQHVENEFLF